MKYLTVDSRLMTCVSPYNLVAQIVQRVGPTDSFTVLETRCFEAHREMATMVDEWLNCTGRTKKAYWKKRIADYMPVLLAITKEVSDAERCDRSEAEEEVL